MDDIVLRARIDDSREVYLSPLPKKAYKEAGGKGLGGDYGYFIYEVDVTRPNAGIEIIGKAASIEAAIRIFEIICGSAVPAEA
jgi:hypothetical protein